MSLKLLSHYKATLSVVVQHYKSYGIAALFAYYILFGFIFLGLPGITGMTLTWLLQTNRGWPAICAAVLFIFVSVPIIPILITVLFLIFEWMFNISRLSRLMDVPDYALRNAVEKWSLRSSESKHNSNSENGSST
jgi:hypothetical protein